MKHAALTLLLAAASLAHAEPIGSVDTAFKLIGPDHKIVVDAHDDPKVQGVQLYVSNFQRPITERLQGDFFDDPALAAVTCLRTGKVVAWPASHASPAAVGSSPRERGARAIGRR